MKFRPLSSSQNNTILVIGVIIFVLLLLVIIIIIIIIIIIMTKACNLKKCDGSWLYHGWSVHATGHRQGAQGGAWRGVCSLSCQDLKSCDPHIKTIFISGESFKIAQMRTWSVSIIKSFLFPGFHLLSLGFCAIENPKDLRMSAVHHGGGLCSMASAAPCVDAYNALGVEKNRDAKPRWRGTPFDTPWTGNQFEEMVKLRKW